MMMSSKRLIQLLVEILSVFHQDFQLKRLDVGSLLTLKGI